MAFKTGKDDGCCSINLLKYVMFTYTFFFWLISLCLLGVSIWVFLVQLPYLNLMTSNTFIIATGLMIGVGSLITFVATIGCLAIWKEDRGLIKIYIFLLVIILTCQSLSGILAYTYQLKINDELSVSLYPTFMQNYKYVEIKTKSIDMLQNKLKCCGVHSFEDWKNSTWLLSNSTDHVINNSVPDSCCKTPAPFCGIRDHPSNIYYDGCLDKFVAKLKENLVIISAVGIGFCSVQIFGLLFSICLVVKLKRFEGFKGFYAY